MNTTQPPEGSPLYEKIRKKKNGFCANCKHVWNVDGIWGCGITGKFVLRLYLGDQRECDWYEYDKEMME